MWIRIKNNLIDTDEYVNFCIERDKKGFYCLVGYKKDSLKTILYYGYDYDDSMEQLDRLESFLVEEFENQEPCEAVKEAMKDLGVTYE